MPKLIIKKSSALSPRDAYGRVKAFLSDDKDLKKLDAHYKCDFNDSGLSGNATGKMFKAHMTVRSSGQGSDVEIVVELPLVLALAKGMVEKTITQKLSDSLA